MPYYKVQIELTNYDGVVEAESEDDAIHLAMHDLYTDDIADWVETTQVRPATTEEAKEEGYGEEEV